MGIWSLLDNSGDQIPVTTRPCAEACFVLGVTESLQDHLTRRRCCNATKTFWRVIPLAQHLAVLVGFRGEHGDVTAHPIELDSRGCMSIGGVVVRSLQRAFDRLNDDVEGNLALVNQRSERCHVDVHQPSPAAR